MCITNTAAQLLQLRATSMRRRTRERERRSLRGCGHTYWCRDVGGKIKEMEKTKKKKTREAGNRKQTSRFESAARTFTRLMYKQHAKTSAAHTLATGLKLHQTIFLQEFCVCQRKKRQHLFLLPVVEFRRSSCISSP